MRRCRIQNSADHIGPVAGGCLERIIQITVGRAVILRQGHGGDALQRRLHRATDRAGIERVFSRVVAAVHTRQHQIRAGIQHTVMQCGHHTIGRAALDQRRSLTFSTIIGLV